VTAFCSSVKAGNGSYLLSTHSPWNQLFVYSRSFLFFVFLSFPFYTKKQSGLRESSLLSMIHFYIDTPALIIQPPHPQCHSRRPATHPLATSHLNRPLFTLGLYPKPQLPLLSSLSLGQMPPPSLSARARSAIHRLIIRRRLLYMPYIPSRGLNRDPLAKLGPIIAHSPTGSERVMS